VIVLPPAGAHDRDRRRPEPSPFDAIARPGRHRRRKRGPDYPSTTGTTSFTDLGKDMWSYLTGNEATIDYTFVDMTVEVPRSTGPDSERATWKLNGTLRITTSDKNNRGSVNGSGA
jgi:hypothetical protein